MTSISRAFLVALTLCGCASTSAETRTADAEPAAAAPAVTFTIDFVAPEPGEYDFESSAQSTVGEAPSERIAAAGTIQITDHENSLPSSVTITTYENSQEGPALSGTYELTAGTSLHDATWRQGDRELEAHENEALASAMGGFFHLSERMRNRWQESYAGQRTVGDEWEPVLQEVEEARERGDDFENVHARARLGNAEEVQRLECFPLTIDYGFSKGSKEDNTGVSSDVTERFCLTRAGHVLTHELTMRLSITMLGATSEQLIAMDTRLTPRTTNSQGL